MGSIEGTRPWRARAGTRRIRRAAALLVVPALVAGVVLVDPAAPSKARAEVAFPDEVGPPPHVLRVAGTVVGTSVVATSWSPAVTAPPAEPVALLAAAPAGDTVIEPPPEHFEDDGTVVEPPPAALQAASPGSATGTGTWSVSIGIDDYPGTRHDLRSAVADAVEVDAALAGYGVPGEQRLLLTDREAGAETIQRAIEWLVANAGPEANVVFFYAGHVRKVSRTTEALVAADGDPVDDAHVAALLAPLEAPRAWVAIAGCYGGGFTEVLAPGRILTAAADADDLAYENLDFGRSYLVEYMVRQGMAEGRARSSVEAAYAYADAALASEHPHRRPFQLDQLDGELDLATPDAVEVSPPADPPSQPPASSQPEPQPSGERPPERSDRCLGIGLQAVRCDD